MLGPRIAAARKQAGLSQAELAERLKISPSAMGMYEQGRREPSVQTLVALATELGVSTDYLLMGKPRNQEEADKVSKMLLDRINAADRRIRSRPDCPFSRDELALLFTAILAEPEP